MKVKTTYLEMFAHPERVVPQPREGLAVVHAKKPTVSYYRFLYDAVGRDYDWTSRKKLSDAELAALLNDPRLEVHVLMADGVPAGFAELDRRIDGEIELVQFWLHTCTKDHPAALPNYLKAGFAIYKEEVKEQGYEYDFGDGWRHEVLFEGCVRAERGKRYPICIEAARACPPEDVGGTWGYEEFVAAMADPEHERHEEFREWIGGRFDPEAFDPAKATKRMWRGLPDWRSEGCV